eukprot:1619274-Amphidinium_carterae.5
MEALTEVSHYSCHRRSQVATAIYHGKRLALVNAHALTSEALSDHHAEFRSALDKIIPSATRDGRIVIAGFDLNMKVRGLDHYAPRRIRHHTFSENAKPRASVGIVADFEEARLRIRAYFSCLRLDMGEP